jgi:hypothetical protein
MFDGVKFEVSQLYLSDFRLLPSALCLLPSAFPNQDHQKLPRTQKSIELVLMVNQQFIPMALPNLLT